MMPPPMRAPTPSPTKSPSRSPTPSPTRLPTRAPTIKGKMAAAVEAVEAVGAALALGLRGADA